MKTKTKIAYLTATLLATVASTAVITGCTAGSRYDRSTGEYIDDKGLSSRVRTALSDNTEYKFNDVQVTSFRGTVQLSGFVNTGDQKRRAGDIAEKVTGVKNLENNITVKE